MWTVDQSKIITAEQKTAEARAEQLAAYKAAFDAHLDVVAQERQYDNRLTVPLYVSSANPQWGAEATAFIAWRDAALAFMFARFAEVEDGSISAPTVEDFISSLPAMIWPA